MTSQEKAELGSAAEAETHGQDAQKLSNIQDKVETEQVDNKSCGATLLSEALHEQVRAKRFQKKKNRLLQPKRKKL